MLFIFVRIIPFPPVLFTSAVGINPTRKAAAPIFFQFYFSVCLPADLSVSVSLSLSRTLFVAVDFSSSSSLLLCLNPLFSFFNSDFNPPPPPPSLFLSMTQTLFPYSVCSYLNVNQS